MNESNNYCRSPNPCPNYNTIKVFMPSEQNPTLKIVLLPQAARYLASARGVEVYE